MGEFYGAFAMREPSFELSLVDSVIIPLKSALTFYATIEKLSIVDPKLCLKLIPSNLFILLEEAFIVLLLL